MVKFVKSLLFVLASIVMTLCLIYLPNVSGPVSITFVGVLSCYLGIDVADTIIKSSEMEQGKYKDIHKHKYVISLICLSVMIGVCMFIPDKRPGHACIQLCTAPSTFRHARRTCGVRQSDLWIHSAKL